MRLRLLAAACGLVVVGGGGCGGEETTDPSDRAVAIVTTACGDASRTMGSGVLVGDGRIVTAAHLVIGAESITTDLPDGRETAAIPAVVDTTRDLAVLRIGTEVDVADVVLERVGADAAVRLVGGLESGDVEATVRRAATLVVDEVRGTERHERGGYELDLAIELGDSGSGIYDDDRLVGIVFARSSERDSIAFAIDADEVEAVLDVEPTTWVCDPDDSRLVERSARARPTRHAGRGSAGSAHR
ncbi:MAG: serine protease [Actinomycetota bacterium]